ncbi:MAG: hypothetical protein AB7N76_15785 [Planctomycetota bacterium]
MQTLLRAAAGLALLACAGCAADAPLALWLPRAVPRAVGAPDAFAPVGAPRDEQAERLLAAYNALVYCREVVRACETLSAPGPDLAAARVRLADAELDLARALGGLPPRLARGGGFPPIRWASGYHDLAGVYHMGHPLPPLIVGFRRPTEDPEVLDWDPKAWRERDRDKPAVEQGGFASGKAAQAIPLGNTKQ